MIFYVMLDRREGIYMLATLGGGRCRYYYKFSHGSMIYDRSAAARGVSTLLYVPIVYIYIYILYSILCIYIMYYEGLGESITERERDK